MAFPSFVAGAKALAADVQKIVDVLTGVTGKGEAVALTQVNDSTQYALDVRNLDATYSYGLRVRDEADNVILTANKAAVAVGKPFAVGDNFAVALDGTITSTVLTELIASTTLEEAAASVDLTDIPATYRHLRLLVSARSAKAGAAFDTLVAVLNNDTTNNYYWQGFSVNNTTVSGVEDVTANGGIYVAQVSAATATANLFSPVTLELLDYASTARLKTLLGSYLRVTALSTGGLQTGTVGAVWNSTAAISRITLTAAGGNLEAGTVVSLYGVH